MALNGIYSIKTGVSIAPAVACLYHSSGPECLAEMCERAIDLWDPCGDHPQGGGQYVRWSVISCLSDHPPAAKKSFIPW